METKPARKPPSLYLVMASASKAVLLLRVFSSEMRFSVASENAGAPLHSLPLVFTPTLLEVEIPDVLLRRLQFSF